MKDSAKIIISGLGGQGIRAFGVILGNLLVQRGYEISMLADYDSASRGGTIVTHFVYGSGRIENPVIDSPDIWIKFADTPKSFNAKEFIYDKLFCKEKSGKGYDFSKMGKEKFGKPIYGNSIAIGKILKILGVDLKDFDIKKALPAKLRKDDSNEMAVKLGYGL
ncbi:MAG: oxoacid:ferredoxin oxidoreductase gamma chain [uncultured bacterium]|nr:MAG: oxoacid:ferredoxin oxidoreductase gamma chain [uncultured bacterium]